MDPCSQEYEELLNKADEHGPLVRRIGMKWLFNDLNKIGHIHTTI